MMCRVLVFAIGMILIGCQNEASIVGAKYGNFEVCYSPGGDWNEITWKESSHVQGPSETRVLKDLCIQFDNGEKHMLSDLSVDEIQRLHSEYTRHDYDAFQPETSMPPFDGNNATYSFDTHEASFTYRNGKLVRCWLRKPVVKIGFAIDKELHDLRMSENKMIELFGQPASYRRQAKKSTYF